VNAGASDSSKRLTSARRSSISRREFLARTAAGLLLTASQLRAAPQSHRKLYAFEKPLQFLSNADLAATMAMAGANGIEATVRKGGRVLPKNVQDDLPRLRDALALRGLEILSIATDINDAQPLSESVLRAAAKLGIRRYRMGGYLYDLSKPILPQLDLFAAKLPALVDLTRELGMTAMYQNHSGSDRVGGPVWDIFGLIKQFDPRVIGIGFDIQHATIEGGTSWPIQFKLDQSHLECVYVKDFVWEKGEIKEVPLGQGQVDRKFFPMLSEIGYTGPICLFVEYLEGKKDADTQEAAFSRDFATLRTLLGG
jgi:sugar phosphate isomerase/epimerase